MNLDIDRNFIWVLVFAFIVIALTNKEALPFNFSNLGGLFNFGNQGNTDNIGNIGNECGPQQEPCYIYRSQKDMRERRCF